LKKNELPAGAQEIAQPELEAAMLAAWRHILTHGGAQALPASEAAALLNADSDAAALTADRLRAFQDERGRIHISTTLTYTPEEPTDDPAVPETAQRIWDELKNAREQLNASQAESARLQEELEAAEAALAYTKAEVANLWRVMTNRNFRNAAKEAARESAESARIIQLSDQRSRIRSKIADAREIARRRKWPWSLVS
jgi:hypothetical protein